MSLELDIAKLSRLRQEFGLLKTDYDGLVAAFDRKHSDLTDALDDRKNEIAMLESQIRAQAVKAFEETGSKQPAFGVKINMKDRVTYPDDKAFEWCRERGVGLKFDRTAFERTAKANKESMPDWCVIEKRPVALISNL